MATPKDYYQILGINKNSSPDEIKQAYRKLAREHHPDMVKDGDKAAAETRFKEINEAYQILSDPQKRKMFDQYGASAFAGGAQGTQGQPGAGFGGFGQQQGSWGPFSYSYSSGGNAQDFGFGGDFDPFDVFEQFFGFRGFGGGAQRQPKKGKNLYYQIKISFAEAVFGLEKEIKIESGNVHIKIPAGVRTGMEIRFAEKGMPGPDKAPPGDLFLSTIVEVPKEFEFYDEVILVNQRITFPEAVLGATIDVPCVDLNSKTGIGTAKLKIPEGTQHGSRFLLKGKGLPKVNSRGQSDVVAQIIIEIPKRLSRKQKELLEEYQKSI